MPVFRAFSTVMTTPPRGFPDPSSLASPQHRWRPTRTAVSPTRPHFLTMGRPTQCIRHPPVACLACCSAPIKLISIPTARTMPSTSRRIASCPERRLALVEYGKVLASKNLTLISSYYPQHFENMAIVSCKTTNEYFQYSWGYLHTMSTWQSQTQQELMYVTGPRRLYFTRSFRSTGLSFSLNLPTMAGTYLPTSQKNSTSS